MYRSRICRVGAPVVGALGVFVWVCALVSTAEAFDTPSVKPPASVQPVEAQPSVTPGTQLEAASAKPTRTAMGGACEGGYPGDCDDAQIGIQGGFTHEFPLGDCWDLDESGDCDLATEDADLDGDCDAQDCSWAGLAFPFTSAGATVDTVTISLNTNQSGGDIYITGDSGCNPDVNDIRAALGCALSGLALNTMHTLNFSPVATFEGEKLWVVLRGRDGSSGTDSLGFYDGTTFPAHQVGRSNIIPSEPGNSFLNIAGTGAIGDWTDLHDQGGLGTFYCVDLFANGAPASTFDCVANPDPTGGCCGVEGGGGCGTCPTDANGDGQTNAADLAQLLGAWGPVAPGFCLDTNGDGQINAADLAQLLGAWGPCPIGAGTGCEVMRGFECGAAGGIYLGDGTTCDDCQAACNDDAGSCCEDNGTAGCDSSGCCHYVCNFSDGTGDPFCCGDEGGVWDSTCAQKANDTDVGCGQFGGVCQPTVCTDSVVAASEKCIQTGTNYNEDGTLGIATDEYGAWASAGWSGGEEGGCDFGDKFKPVGFPAIEGVFGNALFIYYPDVGGDPDDDRRAICSGVPNHISTYPVDIGPTALFPEVPADGEGVLSDSNDDGVMDTMTSQFILCEPLADIALTFDVTQKVERVASGGGMGVGVLTQVYEITNTAATPAAFNWIRQVDSDLLWIGDAGDDAVGTFTNGSGDDVSVYTMENLRPTTAVTLSSPQGAFYYGGKGDFDPDGVGECVAGTCSGGPHDGEACDMATCPDDINADVPECVCSGGPIFGCGTDFQQWNGFGLPEAWADYVANVGHNTNGDSGGSPAGCNGDSGGCSCDGSIGVGVDVSLAPGESTCVCIQYTYGQQTPWMGGFCPEGCN